MKEKIKKLALKRFPSLKGDVCHALKSSDVGYAGFGEAYFSLINEEQIKGWKRHSKMTLNLVVPRGMVRFVFFESRENPEFYCEVIGEDAYNRLLVPPKIWFAFQCVSKTPAIVLNVASIEHDPKEVERLELNEVPYDWSLCC